MLGFKDKGEGYDSASDILDSNIRTQYYDFADYKNILDTH